MAMSGGRDDGAPMIEMNMTPLIDVLLVLLIMFIITIPVATHAVNIDLPQPSQDLNTPDVDPVINKIVLSPTDQILWNGEPISQGELVGNLQESLRFDGGARAAVRARSQRPLRPRRQGARDHQGERRDQVRLRRQRAVPQLRHRLTAGRPRDTRGAGLPAPFRATRQGLIPQLRPIRHCEPGRRPGAAIG